MSIALAFVLVAFEWKAEASPLAAASELAPEPPTSEPAPVPWLRQKKDEQKAAKPRTRKQPAGPIIPGEEPVAPESKEAPETGPAAEPGPIGDDSTSERVPYGDEPIETPPAPWNGVEQRPYFRKCLDSRRSSVDECTERTIELHLKRHFVVPETMRREERTTVSIVIDAEGRIAQVVCVPKPSPAVSAEIERVIRALPEMNPATQNGKPVPVVFQLPFRVSRL
ncbi:MAG: hypothetical protein IPM12_01970 [Flavobacteriales bacterium]|nr:hypothetical protein [Flavobacteriales bacterium]